MKRFTQPSERWIFELESLGWRKQSATVWVSPEGHLYRGPYKAWCLATKKGWPPKEASVRP